VGGNISLAWLQALDCSSNCMYWLRHDVLVVIVET
jgi:hypothetical protein